MSFLLPWRRPQKASAPEADSEDPATMRQDQLDDEQVEKQRDKGALLLPGTR